MKQCCTPTFRSIRLGCSGVTVIGRPTFTKKRRPALGRPLPFSRHVIEVLGVQEDDSFPMERVIEAFIASATFDIRFIPGIELSRAGRIAQALLSELKALGSHGAQAHVICRDDHSSITIEDVELGEWTGTAYQSMLELLRGVAQRVHDEE